MAKFKEYFVYNVPNTVLVLGTGVSFTDVQLNISQSDFTFKRTIHTATDNRIYKRIFDNTSGRFLFKGNEDLRAVSGVSLNGLTAYGFTPYNWPIPYTAKRNSIITISLSDFSGSQNTLDLSYHGENILESAPLDRQGKPVDYNDKTRVLVPIAYESGTITPSSSIGAQAQGLITTDKDADFVCTKISAVVTTDGYLTIQDLGRDVYWQNSKTRIGNAVGNGQFPNVLPCPRFVQGNSTLLITFENNTNSANSLKLYLHGYKRF